MRERQGRRRRHRQLRRTIGRAGLQACVQQMQEERFGRGGQKTSAPESLINVGTVDAALKGRSTVTQWKGSSTRP